jgi:glucuronate isomerase
MGNFSVHDIFKRFAVRVICTTDDPVDSLEYHAQIRALGIGTQVFPAFRPDRAFKIEDPSVFNRWIDKLRAAANVEIDGFSNFLEALEKRHEFFHQQNCRLSDHGLDYCYVDPCTEAEAASIFAKVRRGEVPAPAEHAQFTSFLMLFFGQLDAKKGWTKQLHLGAYRSVNTRMYQRLGKDVGFDSIGDWPQGIALGKYLDQLEQDQMLPKMVVYNLNPADNYVFASMIGNFAETGRPGKLQFGSGWWFLDQKNGIEAQLDALSNCGLLSHFIGMLTDSRSFMSYPRHEYFRRVLCNLLGSEMERGELPNDKELVGGMIRNICFDNAVSYFDLPSLGTSAEPEIATMGS